MLIDKVSKRQPRSFRARFRGYSPDQVDEELTAMDEELRSARADVEATSRRCEHLTETLDQTRADRDALLRRYQELAVRAEAMEAELERLRPDPDKRLAQTPAALHMQRLIETAEDEATIIRRAAIEQSDQLRERAEDLLRRRVELVEQTEQEAQRCMAKAAEQADQIVQQAVQQSQLLLKEIQERQAAFDATYAAFEPPDLVPAPRQDTSAEQGPRPDVSVDHEQPADV